MIFHEVSAVKKKMVGFEKKLPLFCNQLRIPALKVCPPEVPNFRKKKNIFLPVWIFMNFCSIQFLKNTKNIYGFWEAQKSTLCWILSWLGTPTTSRNWKMWNWRWPKVKYSYLPLKLYTKTTVETLEIRWKQFPWWLKTLK